MNAEPMFVLLYDEACRLCIGVRRLLAWMDRNRRVTFLPLQDPQAARLAGPMDSQRFWNAFHLAQPGGRVLTGAAAIPAVIRLLPGGAPLAWLLEHLPGLPWLTARAYQWVAAHRMMFGCRNCDGTPTGYSHPSRAR
ncbi:MAG: DUF393 domain-containing protein [Elusimicrobia bacterium]|nr:DUF393 domain-containing protein [Elusimicrobiota bacterium]